MKQFVFGLLVGVLLTSFFVWIFIPEKKSPPQDETAQLSEAGCLEFLAELGVESKDFPSPGEPCPSLEELLQAQPKEEPQELPSPDLILPPPTYAANLPSQLQTRHPGEVLISWDPVLGAQRYRVSVYGLDGEVITTRTTTHGRMYLQRIPYAGGEAPYVDYKVRLSTQNANGEWGKEGPERDLRVLHVHGHFAVGKDQADPLSPPAIEAIVVED